MTNFVVIEKFRRELDQRDFELCLMFEMDYFDVGGLRYVYTV
jgi:hypothetical protein